MKSTTYKVLPNSFPSLRQTVYMSTQLEAGAAAELLGRYSIAIPRSNGSGPRPLHGGYKASLGGHRRPDGAKLVTFRIKNISDSKFCPFESDEAAHIVRRFQEQHLLPKHAALARMIENLIELAAKMYAYEQIDSFVLDDIHMHESDYSIGKAQIFASTVLPLRHRQQTADQGSLRYDSRLKCTEKNSRRQY
jgi:hypothetical protein